MTDSTWPTLVGRASVEFSNNFVQQTLLDNCSTAARQQVLRTNMRKACCRAAVEQLSSSFCGKKLLDHCSTEARPARVGQVLSVGGGALWPDGTHGAKGHQRRASPPELVWPARAANLPPREVAGRGRGQRASPGHLHCGRHALGQCWHSGQLPLVDVCPGQHRPARLAVRPVPLVCTLRGQHTGWQTKVQTRAS